MEDNDDADIMNTIFFFQSNFSNNLPLKNIEFKLNIVISIFISKQLIFLFIIDFFKSVHQNSH